MRWSQLKLTAPVLLLLLLSFVSISFGQTPAEVYNQYCKSCHTIGGGRLIGPDLKDVSQRQEREWLVNWILDPIGILNSKDAYALKMLQEYGGVMMTPTPGMTKSMANAILDLIDSESTKEISELSGIIAETEREISSDDVLRGQDYFLGMLSFKSRAPACIGCHTVNNLPGNLGGGRLGPDLSDAFTRLGERRGLTAWLSAPPQPTMSPIFNEHPLDEMEIHALVAYLKNGAGSGKKTNATAIGHFMVLSVLFTIAVIALFGSLWSSRFKGIRLKMVRDSYSSSERL